MRGSSDEYAAKSTEPVVILAHAGIQYFREPCINNNSTTETTSLSHCTGTNCRDVAAHSQPIKNDPEEILRSRFYLLSICN